MTVSLNKCKKVNKNKICNKQNIARTTGTYFIKSIRDQIFMPGFFGFIIYNAFYHFSFSFTFLTIAIYKWDTSDYATRGLEKHLKK